MLSIPELQQRVDDLQRAYLSGTRVVRFSDGKTQEFQSMADMRTAIQDGENWIAQQSGGANTRCTFAQHKRGDGPGGPDSRWYR